MSQKLGEIHLFVRYGVYKVFGSLPAVTLTFDRLTPKSNQHIYEHLWPKLGKIPFIGL